MLPYCPWSLKVSSYAPYHVCSSGCSFGELQLQWRHGNHPSDRDFRGSLRPYPLGLCRLERRQWIVEWLQVVGKGGARRQPSRANRSLFFKCSASHHGLVHLLNGSLADVQGGSWMKPNLEFFQKSWNWRRSPSRMAVLLSSTRSSRLWLRIDDFVLPTFPRKRVR